MVTEFEAFDLPPLRQVDFDALDAPETEAPFLRESFELLKDVAAVLMVVASLRSPAQASGLSRNHAIVVGHFVRVMKLLRTLVRQISDGHTGDQQIMVNRAVLDSASTVMYLLQDSGDGSRFDAYVFDSLVSEREFLSEVRRQVDGRGGEVLPIEERIRSSISSTLDAAGVEEGEIPSRKKNGWPSAETRLRVLGDAAYVAYRTGSGAVHGSFDDLVKNHLVVEGEGFEVSFESKRFRPQPLLSMAMVSLLMVRGYARAFLHAELPKALTDRCSQLYGSLRRVDELHEAWMNAG